MKRGDHLPRLHSDPLCMVSCACGARFETGDEYQHAAPISGKVTTKTIKTINDAKLAHKAHYFSADAETRCDHWFGVRWDRVICPECLEPLPFGDLEGAQ